MCQKVSENIKHTSEKLGEGMGQVLLMSYVASSSESVKLQRSGWQLPVGPLGSFVL